MMMMMMPFAFSEIWLFSVFLLACRLAAMLLVTPVFAALTVTTSVRMLLVVALAVALAIGLPQDQLPQVPDAGGLVAALMVEVLIGGLLGLGVQVAFAAFSIAGQLLDVQIGFGIAQIFDPVTRRQVPVLTSAFNQLAIVIFFISNGHHLVIRGLAFSVERYAPGKVNWFSLQPGPVFAQAGSLFSLGFALAAPVVFCILLLDIALGVLTRNLPQMQMFALAIPLKIVAGLAAIGLWLVAMPQLMMQTYGTIFHSWEALFR